MSVPPSAADQSPVLPPVAPVAPTAPAPPRFGYAPQAGPVGDPAKTNVMAILSLVFAFVCAPVGIAMGMIARKQIKATGEGGAGLAKAGLILSSVFTALTFLSVLAAALLVGYGVSQANNMSSPDSQEGLHAAMVGDAKSMATMQEAWVAEHSELGGFDVEQPNAGDKVMVGDQEFLGFPGNAVSVFSVTPDGANPGGYCVIVVNPLANSGMPVLYDSQLGHVVGNGDPAPICDPGQQ